MLQSRKSTTRAIFFKNRIIITISSASLFLFFSPENIQYSAYQSLIGCIRIHVVFIHIFIQHAESSQSLRRRFTFYVHNVPGVCMKKSALREFLNKATTCRVKEFTFSLAESFDDSSRTRVKILFLN